MVANLSSQIDIVGQALAGDFNNPIMEQISNGTAGRNVFFQSLKCSLNGGFYVAKCQGETLKTVAYTIVFSLGVLRL